MAALISVIIPTKNAGPEFAACLASLRMQDFRRYDVHVVDAASADGTPETAAAFQAGLGEGMQFWSAPDSGVYEAMNLGIARSEGEWLYFLGADDVLRDSAVFGDVAGLMAADEADLIYGDADFRNAGQRYGGVFTLDRLLFEGNICHQAIFYRRSVFETVGGYSMRYPIWADWDLNIRCFRHPAIRARWFDRVIAVYNDASGISRQEDPVFRRELPVMLHQDARREMRALMSSRSYRYGKKLLGWLD